MSVNTLVSISPEAHQVLVELAQETQTSVENILNQAIEARRRQVFLERTNESFAALREDPDAWRSYCAEIDGWETTLGDGL